MADDSRSGNHTLVLGTFGRGFYERSIPGNPIIYVDKSATGIQDGSFEHPYQSVAAAVSVAAAGSIVAIRGNTYSEPQVIDKQITLVTYMSPTWIN